MAPGLPACRRASDPTLRSHSIANYDLTIRRSIPITKRIELSFRTEFFILFNRVQFNDPNTSLGNPQFGIVSGTMNLPRLIRFGLRLDY